MTRRHTGQDDMLANVVSDVPKDIYNNVAMWEKVLSDTHVRYVTDILKFAPDSVKNDIKVWKNILGNYPSPSTVIDVMSAIPSNVMTSELYVDLMTKLSGQGHTHGNYEAAYIDKHDTLENWNQIIRANDFCDSSLNYVPDKILHSKEFWEDALFDEDDTLRRIASNSDMPDEVVTQEFFDQLYSKDPKVTLQSPLKKFASERHWAEYVSKDPLMVLSMPDELTTDELWDNAEATYADNKIFLDVIQDYRAKRDRRRGNAE